MKDDYGRPLTSLRISITQKCDLNCFYCHREGCERENREMNVSEISKLVEVAADFGTKKIKITGGEPLIRDDIVDIVDEISQLPVEDISITTNGVTLSEKVDALAEAGLDRVNISLDTLNPETYESITGKDSLEKVLKGIDFAIEAGLHPVKLNTLILDGINDGEEIDGLINYSLDKGAILQLIELEKVLPENEKIYKKYHKDLDSIEEKIRKKASDVETRWLMQARRKYLVDGGEVEVVNPMHNSEFCKYCTRLRMTAGGYLKPCLMRNDNLVDVLTPVRNKDEEKIREAYETAIKLREPYFH
ncbi:molybdenum cofactor biosynthesis protein MoeA [candidate division MSBL1 archaeon SCGC-AAA382A03]|uniref:Probable GTP 3',8-cyclase n=1 Tax=candidate division MSBL1 archaeon SCGC-AAA382A03 TaxID=1698278 RepID=A0A133VDY6_9EURY|nr:molybdenum cofactor biosynthesis protein MoeA [candidate division MSBL1 archaeon SCGC-AAA382A03]